MRANRLRAEALALADDEHGDKSRGSRVDVDDRTTCEIMCGGAESLRDGTRRGQQAAVPDHVRHRGVVEGDPQRHEQQHHRDQGLQRPQRQFLAQKGDPHPAIGGGRQTTLDPHTCARVLHGDTVVISVASIPDRAIPVAPFFHDGDTLTECYSEQQVTVQNGTIRLPGYHHGVAVLALTTHF